MTQQVTVKDFFQKDEVKKRFEEMLGKRAPQFITSVLQIATSNALLKNADPVSVYNAAAVAATLDLPLNSSLGFAYIVPYNTKQPDGSSKVVAQFQIGYKGFIQLAQRSGQFRSISATPIYEGQIKENNPLTGITFDFSVKSDVVIGYAARFELINGFEKTMYMTVAELQKHGARFSKSYNNATGLWKQDFDTMATKTVIKQLISKFAPLSVEMQKAVITDQGHVIDYKNDEVEYVDAVAEVMEVDKEQERIYLMIQDADSIEKLKKLEKQVPEDLLDAYQFKLDNLQSQANASK